jgi:plastocyanin
MKRFMLSALLGAAVVMVTVQEARSQYGGHHRVTYGPVYYCPPPVYYAPPVYHRPMYYSAPSYVRPTPKAVTVGAYDKVGFKPKSINVEPGTTVRWVNYGEERHTVTSKDGLFDSGPLAPGATFSVQFNRPGTFNYYCKPHEKMGMVGTVVVGDGGARPEVEVGAYDKVGFKPKMLNVEPGTTVRWVNHGKEAHTVTSKDGLFDSGPMSPGGSYKVTFKRTGTFHYYCKPHEKMGMVGTVVVGSGGSGDSGPGSGGSGY